MYFLSKCLLLGEDRKSKEDLQVINCYSQSHEIWGNKESWNGKYVRQIKANLDFIAQ